jgi:hypothetical protein
MTWAAVVAASLLLGACAPVMSTTGPATPSTEGEYRAIWDAAHPPSYTYTIERTCFCLPLGPLAVTVQDGRVTSIVTKDDRRLKPDGPRLTSYPVSIDALFDYVAEAERDADQSEVGYDPTLGYPAVVDIDWTSATPDDNVTIEVSDFR